MYYVTDLEQRAILTYRDGARITYVNEDLARQDAARGEQVTNRPHAVVPVAYVANDSLQRLVAPWLV